MDRGELEGLDREALVVKAQAAGIRRARILTRPELIDELLRLDPSTSPAQLKKSRGFFGKARDLVARVVERGLHLPDAADRIRTLSLGTPPYEARGHRGEPQAMPTVTLAEIYAAQGHRARAIETLRRVLEREPEHGAARVLLARLEDEAYVAPQPPLPPEPEVEPELSDDADDGAEEALAAEALTIETPVARGTVLGPSDQNGEAEFALAPPSDETPGASHRAGRRYTFTASDEGNVDETATTDVFRIVPEAAVEVDAGIDGPTVVLSSAALRPEIDECIAIPVPRDDAGGRMYVRWSVSWSTIGALLGAMPTGRFVVRAHVVTPSWDAPSTETRDLTVDPDAEQATLVGLPEPSVVRVAVGWLDGPTFVPLAHSPALEMTDGRGLVLWTTRGIVPVVLDDPRAASIARAVDASRRASQART